MITCLFESLKDSIVYNSFMLNISSHMEPENQEHLDKEEAVCVVGQGGADIVAAERPVFCYILIQGTWAGDLDKPKIILEYLLKHY